MPYLHLWFNMYHLISIADPLSLPTQLIFYPYCCLMSSILFRYVIDPTFSGSGSGLSEFIITFIRACRYMYGFGFGFGIFTLCYLILCIHVFILYNSWHIICYLFFFVWLCDLCRFLCMYICFFFFQVALAYVPC